MVGNITCPLCGNEMLHIPDENEANNIRTSRKDEKKKLFRCENPMCLHKDRIGAI